MVISDHSDQVGIAQALKRSAPEMMKSEQGKKWSFGVLVSNAWSLGDRADAINAFLSVPFARDNITEEWFFIADPVLTAEWSAPSSEG